MATKSATTRGFVDGVISSLRSDAAAKHAVPRVEAFLTKVTQKANDENEAIAESAIALSLDQIERLTETLSKLVGHPVKIKVDIKESLIAGLRIKVGEWIIDTSVQNQLSQIQQSLWS